MIKYYRFQPEDTCEDKRLEKFSIDKLWFSDPAEFNDLFDMKLTMKDLTYRSPWQESSLKAAYSKLFEDKEIARHYLFDEDLLLAVNDWLKEDSFFRMEDLLPNFVQRFKSFGVACLTSNWNSQLMWAHYASQHRGFCIEYEIHPMNLAIHNNGIAQIDVGYISNLPEICISELLFSPHQALAKVLGTKATEWAYEKEYRLVHFKKMNCLVDMPKHMSVSRLIAGNRMSENALTLIKSKAAEFKIPAVQMELARNSNYEWNLGSL